MTKTLTEQWREGTLPQGNYYIVIRGIEKEQIMIDYYIPELHHFEIKPSECIKEVLEPVPDYGGIKRLQEQLKEANRLLKYYLQEGVLVQFASGDYVDPKDAKLYFEKWGVK